MCAPLVRQRLKSKRRKRRRTLQRFPHSPGSLVGLFMAVRVFERDERVNAVPTTVLSSSPRTLFSAAREKRKEKAREDRGGGAFCTRELPLAYLVFCVFKQPNYFPIDIDFSDRITPRSLRSPRRDLTFGSSH